MNTSKSQNQNKKNTSISKNTLTNINSSESNICNSGKNIQTSTHYETAEFNAVYMHDKAELDTLSKVCNSNIVAAGRSSMHQSVNNISHDSTRIKHQMIAMSN
jgi:hypothetical protein